MATAALMLNGSRNSNSAPSPSKKGAPIIFPGRKRDRKSKAVSAEAVSLNLIVSRQARVDIREGAHWYDERDPAVCGRFLDAVGAAFDTVAEAPQRWPMVKGLPSNRPMHYYVMSGFPYTIVYQWRAEDTVEIVAVAHQKRQTKYWKSGTAGPGPRG
jgi:plasmid stabilization system protein ParE